MKDEQGGKSEQPIEDVTYHIQGENSMTCFTDRVTKKKRYVAACTFKRKIVNRDNLAEPIIQEVPIDFQIKASSVEQAFRRRLPTAKKALEEFKRRSMNPPSEEKKPDLKIVGG